MIARGDMSSGELRLWMRERKISVEKLAEALGIHERTVYRWRSGVRLPAYLPLALNELDRQVNPVSGTHMPTPDEEWGDVVWRAHWPIMLCPDTSEVHSMQHMPASDGVLKHSEWFQCLNCYMWFDSDESAGFFAAAARMGELVNKHKN